VTLASGFYGVTNAHTAKAWMDHTTTLDSTAALVVHTVSEEAWLCRTAMPTLFTAGIANAS
jgi:hypothetical protein